MSTIRDTATAFVVGATPGGGAGTAIAQPTVTERATSASVERAAGNEAATSGCEATVHFERLADGEAVGTCFRIYDACAIDLDDPSAPVLVDKCPTE